MRDTRRTYRFGFALSTGAGNRTRYLNLRKYAERDPTLECSWAPNPGHVADDPFRRLPEGLYRRLLAARFAAPVMRQLSRLDAVMFHAFDPYVFAALRSFVARKPLLVWSQDDPPSADPEFWRHYGVVDRSALRARLRFATDTFCARRAGLFIPFSRWTGDILIDECGVRRDRVHPINVGVDLALWPYTARTDARPPKILFVGGDFKRKGGPLLVDVFARRVRGDAELHVVTLRAPKAPMPARAFVHTGLTPNDPELRRLFAEAAFVVLPTRSDMVPNVILEGMASGAPVVATRVGGIPDLIDDGQTGYVVPVDDEDALADRMQRLLDDPALRLRMGAAGRARVEAEFSAEVNVPRILTLMKRAVDQA